ncbi:MAG: hypothetical protein H5U01_15565, partial [Clostridia bacterium]|nr:hypothetical protein [Clostridia bacterium]
MRVALRYGAMGRDREDEGLFEKVRAGTATPEEEEEEERYRRRQEERITRILEARRGRAEEARPWCLADPGAQGSGPAIRLFRRTFYAVIADDSQEREVARD